MRAPTGLALDRRAFLKLGVAGSMTLAVAGIGGTLAGCDRREQAAAQGFGFLRDADLALFRALAPVVLEGLPLDAALVDDTLHGIDRLLARSEKASRDALVQLLDLLHLAPARWLTTGVAAGWDAATPDDVRGFLERWRSSRVALFNIGYGGLVRLVGTGYFATPRGFASTGYPGPPERVRGALDA